MHFLFPFSIDSDFYTTVCTLQKNRIFICIYAKKVVILQPFCEKMPFGRFRERFFLKEKYR